jgi:hypothetical protein
LKDFTEKEADIIYKLKYKGREIIFYCLLELQSTVDYTMPFRLLVYMVELLRKIFMETEPNIRESASYALPAVIPIVLYNGAENWTAKKSFKEYLSGYELYGGRVIDFTYILLDVNKYGAESLAEIGNLISAVFMLDKKQDETKFTQNLQEAMNMVRNLSPGEQADFESWLRDVLLKKAGLGGRELVNGALEDLKTERNVQDMTYAIERLFDEIEGKGIEKGIEKGIKEGIKEGIEKGISELIERMLKKGKSVETIAYDTDVSVEQIMKINARLESAVSRNTG